MRQKGGKELGEKGEIVQGRGRRVPNERRPDANRSNEEKGFGQRTRGGRSSMGNRDIGKKEIDKIKPVRFHSRLRFKD